MASGRLCDNRPEIVPGFRFFQGNNRDGNRKVPGRLFGRLLHTNGHFAQRAHPHGAKKRSLRVLVGRHISTSPILTYYLLHALQNTRHTSRVHRLTTKRSIYVFVSSGMSHWRTANRQPGTRRGMTTKNGCSGAAQDSECSLLLVPKTKSTRVPKTTQHSTRRSEFARGSGLLPWNKKKKKIVELNRVQREAMNA